MKQFFRRLIFSFYRFLFASYRAQSRRFGARRLPLNSTSRTPHQRGRLTSTRRFSVSSLQPRSHRSADLPMALKATNGSAMAASGAKKPPEKDDVITYTVPRAEAIEMLNRGLRLSELTEGHLAEEHLAEGHLAEGYLKGQYDSIPQTTPEPMCPQLSESLIRPIDKAYLAECSKHYKAAEKLYLKSLSWRRKQFGEDHLENVIALKALANLYCKQGRNDEAQPLLTQALAIQTQIETASVELGETSYQLARLYQRKEQYAEADELFQRAAMIFRQQLGPQHPRTQAVHSDLMNLLVNSIELNKFEELNAGATPLDLDRLSETYSWAKPPWKR